MNTNDGLRGPSDAWGLRRGGDLGFDVHELGIRSLLRHSLSIGAGWLRVVGLAVVVATSRLRV